MFPIKKTVLHPMLQPKRAPYRWLKARNSKRTSDIRSLQTQVEAFYAQNGYYPSLNDLNSASWLATNMKSFDSNALIEAAESGNVALTQLVMTRGADIKSRTKVNPLHRLFLCFR